MGKDVAEILGYTNQNRDIIRHVDEEDRMMVNHESQLNTETVSSLGQRGGWLINESGLYSLILSSKLPTAKHKKNVKKNLKQSLKPLDILEKIQYNIITEQVLYIHNYYTRYIVDKYRYILWIKCKFYFALNFAVEVSPM